MRARQVKQEDTLGLFFDIPFGLLMGASVAVAARRNSSSRLWLHPAHICAWIVGLLVFAPISAYGILRYPDWSLMYVVPGTGLSTPLQILAIAAHPLVMALGALICLAFLGRSSNGAALFLIGGATAASVGLLVWGYDRLWRVGSFEAYHEGARTYMPTLMECRLGLALVIMIPALLAVWTFTLATLRRHSTTYSV